VRVTELRSPALRRVRAALDAGGFVCPAVDSAFLKRPATEPVDWPGLERSLEAAEALGAPLVRIFSGLRGTRPPAPDWLVETLAQAVEQAQGSGIGVALELEHDCAVATRAEAAAALVEGLGLVWDPANEARSLGAPPDPDGHAAVAQAIRHVHVKDTTVDAWVAPGLGLVDWEGELRRLAAHGYDGYISLETHHELPDGGKVAASQAALAALRELAARADVTLA
jgi:sugar phosphate isomerase/epimerase